ncbi:f-box protein at-b [Quercus suber]|uniref:F-box protein at-b n=1 Tax=Quercus suber TaxID=58331 RepID=A0AAW0M9U4_QUESU
MIYPLEIEGLEVCVTMNTPKISFARFKRHPVIDRKLDTFLREDHEEQPWLTLCLDGREMGCHDGWQFHRPEYR